MNNIDGGKTMNSVSRYHNTSVTNRTLYPGIPYSNRVIGDGGVISDNAAMVGLYDSMLSLLPNTDLLVVPDGGIKTRMSGIYSYVSKAYDMGIAGLDATQTVEANQPYLSGNIAPNERKAFNVTNSTIRYLSIPQISKLGTDKWSICILFKWSGEDKSTRSTLFSSTTSAFLLKVGGFNTFDLISQTGVESTVSNISALYSNKNTILHLVADGTGALQMYINGILITSWNSTTDRTKISITNLMSSSTTNLFDGKLSYFQVLNKNLSKSEIESQYTYLRSQYPEIEGTAIGNQMWATSNYEGVVTGNGTVIPEVQSASTSVAPELITNGGFNTDTIWNKGTGWTINGGVASRDGSSTSSDLYNTSANSKIQVGKVYTITFTTTINAGKLGVSFGGAIVVDNIITSGTYSYNVLTKNIDGIYFTRCDGLNGTIDNVSIKEVGWADLTTPAWCYYNNDPVLGSVYGKLYNYYAVQEIAKNPPKGWRVPTSADFTQLSTYLGGNSVAGGKLKKDGFSYWFSPNVGATNESGLTILGCGLRLVDGTFSLATGASGIYSSNAYRLSVLANETTLYIVDSSTEQKRGCSIRLIRTSPVGDQTQNIKVDRFTTNIASGTANKDVSIPFGYEVRAINVKSAQSLTNLQCVMYNYGGGTSQATLITGKSVAAGAEIKFSVNVDCPVQYQDPVLRFNATGNGGDGMEINIVLHKII